MVYVVIRFGCNKDPISFLKVHKSLKFIEDSLKEYVLYLPTDINFKILTNYNDNFIKTYRIKDLNNCPLTGGYDVINIYDMNDFDYDFEKLKNHCEKIRWDMFDRPYFPEGLEVTKRYLKNSIVKRKTFEKK